MVTATHMSKNFSRKEVECPCCEVLPSVLFINLVQKLRDKINRKMPVTSGHRCKTYNKKIGGFYLSTHMFKQNGAAYGTVDIKVGRYDNRFRWVLVTLALKLGFNNIEVANFHVHLARVPVSHPGYNKIIWGRSK